MGKVHARVLFCALLGGLPIAGQTLTSPRSLQATTTAYPYPFGGTSQQVYQQIHSDTIGSPLAINRLIFPQGSANVESVARVIVAELRIGPSSIANLSATFAANFTSAPTLAIAQRVINLPSLTQWQPANSVQLVFDQTWQFSGQSEIAWQLNTYSNSSPQQGGLLYEYDVLAASFPDLNRASWGSSGPACRVTGSTRDMWIIGSCATLRSSLQTTFYEPQAYDCPTMQPIALLLGLANPTQVFPGLCATVQVGSVFAAFQAITDAGGSARFFGFAGSVNYVPALGGATFYAQAAALDSTRCCSQIPVALSGGATITIPLAVPAPPFAWVAARDSATAAIGSIGYDRFAVVKFAP